MKEAVILTKNEYEVLLMNVHNILREVKNLKSCFTVSEITHAAMEMEKVLDGRHEEGVESNG